MLSKNIIGGQLGSAVTFSYAVRDLGKYRNQTWSCGVHWDKSHTSIGILSDRSCLLTEKSSTKSECARRHMSRCPVGPKLKDLVLVFSLQRSPIVLVRETIRLFSPQSMLWLLGRCFTCGNVWRRLCNVKLRLVTLLLPTMNARL